MIVIRLREARFVEGERLLAGPFSLEVAVGERAAYRCLDEVQAAILARMAAGLVKATSGSVTIGDYDPAVQPVQCKRLVGFVAHEPARLERRDLERYVAYRAALWNVDADAALERARAQMAQLEGLHAAFALPLVGALIARPSVVVLDRPQAAYATQILALVAPCALFTTHVEAGCARAFGPIARALHSA